MKEKERARRKEVRHNDPSHELAVSLSIPSGTEDFVALCENILYRRKSMLAAREIRFDHWCHRWFTRILLCEQDLQCCCLHLIYCSCCDSQVEAKAQEVRAAAANRPSEADAKPSDRW